MTFANYRETGIYDTGYLWRLSLNVIDTIDKKVKFHQRMYNLGLFIASDCQVLYTRKIAVTVELYVGLFRV